MLVVTWNDDGKHRSNSSCVSFADKTDYGLVPVNLSNVFGQGSCYGGALEEFLYEFDKKLDELHEFRKMLDKSYNYQDIVYVDCFGKEIRRGE